MNFILLLDFIVNNRIPVLVWNRDGEPRFAFLESWLAKSVDTVKEPGVAVAYVTSLPFRKLFSPDLVEEITFNTEHEGGLTANIHLRW